MRLARPGAVFAVFVAGAIVLGACGDDGGASGTPTRPPDTVYSPTSAPAGRTPFPSPVIENNVITSKKGYTATLPEGWRVRADFVLTADGSADGFFEPLKPGANVQANIVITCTRKGFSTDDERIVFEKTKTAREGLNKDITVSNRTVAGRQATVLSYHFESQNENTPPLDKTDYLFSDSRCDWKVTTTTAAGQRDAYQPTFDIFLNSLQLTS